jgi:hypothetical protein
MAHAPLGRVAMARTLLALIVVLGVTACGAAEQPALPAPQASASAPPVDPLVTASGLPEGDQIEVTDTSAGVESGENLDFVSPVFTVAPIGPLEAPITVTVEVDNALPATTPLLVATRKTSDAPWTLQRGRLASDQRHVDFQTSSLDQVGIMAINLDGTIASFDADVRKGLLGGLDRKVKKPTCEATDAAKKDGYSVASTKPPKSLFWCFGLEDEKRVVRVTNRMKFPVQVNHPKVAVLSEPRKAAVLAPWDAILGSTYTLMAPGTTATYDATLEPKFAMGLGSDSGAVVQSLRLLRAGVQALVTRSNRFGFGTTNSAATYKALLAMPQCASSLGKGGDALLKGCFSPGKVAKIFGARAIMLTPLMSSPEVPALFQAQAQALATQSLLPVRQRIVVRRAAPDFKAFTGYWTGPERLVTVTGEGLVTEKLSEGCCDLVIKLTYQLEDPVKNAGNATARATIVSVKVGKRKLLEGRVPRVGQKGTFTVRNGVVRPPYLNKNYCNQAATKRKACRA